MISTFYQGYGLIVLLIVILFLVFRFWRRDQRRESGFCEGDILAFPWASFNLCINCDWLYDDSYAACPVCTSLISMPVARIFNPEVSKCKITKEIIKKCSADLQSA